MRIKQEPVSEKVHGMGARKKEFMVKFYRWALKDAQRECSGGFPFLSRLKSTMVVDFLEFVERLTTIERRALQVCMVKRFHEEGAFLAGDRLSSEEGALIERFLKRNIKCDKLLGPISVLSHSEAKRAKELASGSKKYQIQRSKLRSALREKLVPAVVGPAETLHRTNTESRYCTTVGKWTVHTAVHTGGRLFQLSYSQLVSLRPDICLVEHASIMNWLGIAGQTNWDLLTNRDIPDAANLVLELTSHFLTAMSKLEKAL
jgi:hypothetical protein